MKLEGAHAANLTVATPSPLVRNGRACWDETSESPALVGKFQCDLNSINGSQLPGSLVANKVLATTNYSFSFILLEKKIYRGGPYA